MASTHRSRSQTLPLQGDNGALADDDFKSNSVDIDDGSSVSKGSDLGKLSEIDSRADVTIKYMDDDDDTGDAMDLDDGFVEHNISIPDTEFDLKDIPRQYDGLATENDTFLMKIIESGAYQSWRDEHEEPARQDPMGYTIGWICAIEKEYVAAQVFLDEKYERPDRLPPNDNNKYTLGRIGKHNIVIAVLPNGKYGVSSAAGVARDMLHSFPNIRIGLLVGIGGGAPSLTHDIRLGDVIVGVSNNGKSAVFQYDFRKAIQGQEFLKTGFLNQPPPVLRTAINGLMAQYEIEGNQLREAVDSVLNKNPRLRKRGYMRPEAITDRLYRSQVIHPLNSGTSCATVCGDDPSSLIKRHQREEDDDDPLVHYGLIASANMLMKDALVRDELIAKEGILCFEMGAAGLMNHFPCLVIRGICDYSDSHKSTLWQGYAAMTAAAYAKDLLHRIAPIKVEAQKKISDVLSENHLDIAEHHRDIAKEEPKSLEDFANERLSKEEQECHQLFRLTSGGKDTTVNEAYEQILNKSTEKRMVRKALSIILAASRPLTLSEMNIAMNIKDMAQDDTTQTFYDLDLENEMDFKSRLRSWCGLVISIYRGKIYFFHQTAREFLLAAYPTSIPSTPYWHHSITTRHAHSILAELCVLYLNLFNSSTIEMDMTPSYFTDRNAFLNYSAENWGYHFHKAHITDNAAIIPATLRICDPSSKSFLAWFKTYQRSKNLSPDGHITDLLIATHYGHHAIVKVLVENGADIEAKDSMGRTPLSQAAENGHEAIVKLLVEKGADIEAKDLFGQTPLSQAAENGHEAIVKLLVENGADIEAKDGVFGRTPLLWAIESGHEAIMQLLVEKGADIEVKDIMGRTPLLQAAENGHEAIVKLLVEKRADSK
ncbi:hypothetical protein TrVGV298_007786 [Trichoderma virens]|nr:hypothetical protein TrVGV298_007786 [Trichoderma virens]